MKAVDSPNVLFFGRWVRRGLIKVWEPLATPERPGDMWDDSELTCARRRAEAEVESSLFDRNRKVETA